MSILDDLVREAESETSSRRTLLPAGRLERMAAAAPAPRAFAAALRRPGLAVIAEMKAKSPSAGPLCADYSPARYAGLYASGGAAALSVLCQQRSFGGSPEHLAEARAVTELPILRKDFITDEYQVLEARAFGADAVLLIVAALRSGRLTELLAFARSLRMEALVEAHDAPEVEQALAAGAELVGVNNRDLRTLAVNAALSCELRALVPADRVMVAESGISTAAHARRLREAGIDAILVGEALMRSPDPAGLVRELASA